MVCTIRVWPYCTRMVYKIVPYAYGTYHTRMNYAYGTEHKQLVKATVQFISQDMQSVEGYIFLYEKTSYNDHNIQEAGLCDKRVSYLHVTPL